MTDQAQRIGAVLAALDRDDVRGSLKRLEQALATELRLDADTVGDLVARGRPRWGVRSAEDAAACVAFWQRLAERHDDPRIKAAFADVLHLLGPRERACESLAAFVAAARRDPEVFVEYSGDFSELPDHCGADARREFELAKIEFYAHRVDQGRMDVEDLQSAMRELLARYDQDPELRARLHTIARESLSSTGG